MKMKLRGVRVIEMPPFKAVSSGLCGHEAMFGENGFDRWMRAHSRLVKDLLYAHPDFMWPEDEAHSVWIWAVKDWVTQEDVAPYELIEYEGGMFVVATADEDDPKDLGETVKAMVKWIEKSGVFALDERPGHRGMGHMTGCGAIQEALGFPQQEIFLPVKFKENL